MPTQTRIWPITPAAASLFICMATSAALMVAVVPKPVGAEVTRFEIDRREPFAPGTQFAAAGSYERIIGRVYYEIDPELPQNRPIVDLDLAPRNGRGRVAFSADLFILAPSDLSKANGAILYDVNNRGNKLALRFFNDAPGRNDPRTQEDAGHGFLMRQGFILVWSGWIGELLPGDDRLRLDVPIASRDDGPITGRVRCEIVPTEDTQRCSITRENHGSYAPADGALRKATVTHRERPSEARIPIPPDQWTLHVADVPEDAPAQLPLVELELPAGMKRGHIYEVIYEARDPQVHGVCFAAVRDLVSALKFGTGENHPLRIDGKAPAARAHGFGVSQSGRFLREFLYWGFNEDEQGRQVFDGLIPHVSGGGLGSFNHRFAQPTRHVTQHDHHDYPADRFPFAYETQHDPVSGREDGILQRAAATGTAPLLLHTQSAAEYWTRSGSLPHTDPLGTRDADLPETVRVYSFGGTQHGSGSWPPTEGPGKYLDNPADYRPLLRALLVALDRWVTDAQDPPPSVYPSIQQGTLVHWNQSSTGFPDIPGVQYPQVIQQPCLLDFGPRWETERIIDCQPPEPRGDYRVLVPRCGPDGNELGTLLPPEVAVPLATYTGWNLRRREAGAENQLVSLVGAYLPLPTTREERESRKDPRLSLEERYGTSDEYRRQLRAACIALQADGYLLEEDVERIIARQRERVAELFERLENHQGQQR